MNKSYVTFIRDLGVVVFNCVDDLFPQNPEIANCAMRNLNGYEIGGRTLRVDSACTEKNRMSELVTGPGGPGAPPIGGGPGGPGGMGGPPGMGGPGGQMQREFPHQSL